jgi:hypothetical protein
MRAQIILCTIGLALALGAAHACAAGVTPGGADILTKSDNNSGHVLHDLGLLSPLPPGSDGPTPTSASAATMSSAEAVPELPTWAMMLLCLAGLGLAGFKKSRKDRLSPGID